MQRQTVTRLDKLYAIRQPIWNHRQWCLLNQKHVNFDSVEPLDVDAAEKKLQRVERLIEVERRRQAKREGWVWP